MTLKTALGVHQGHGNITIRQSAYDFLLAFYSNYTSISCRLRYSMSKNVVTLKLGSEVTQGH